MTLEEARATGTAQGSGPNEVMMGLLDDEGLTSVVATNCEQHYVRPLVLGDRLVVRSVIESVSDPKRTGLGTGRFVTNRMDYVAVPDADVPAGVPVSPEQVQALFDAGEPVATMRFRILKFLPPARPSSQSPAEQQRPPRPRPAITQDNAFFFEGARAHRLLIQRCASCGTLRHPPRPPARVRLVRMGHRRGERPGHRLLLRRRALPPGARVRLPAADRPGRAGGGDPAGRRTSSASSRTTSRSAWRWRPSSSTSTRS